MSDEREHWPRVDVTDPGVPPDAQDREIHKVPKLRRLLVTGVFRDRADPRDRVYNR